MKVEARRNGWNSRNDGTLNLPHGRRLRLEFAVSSACLIFTSPIAPPSKNLGGKTGVLRCVLVNDANLKLPAYCTECRAAIGESYVRAIAGRSFFCSLGCYRRAAEGAKLLPAPAKVMESVAPQPIARIGLSGA
jgi:hypothetical protein